MRAFIALELPTDFHDDVAALARQLSECVKGRFLRPETYHLTLAFLGDIDDAQRSLAMDAIDAATAGLPQIPLSSDGLGKFGRPTDATLWLGVRSCQELTTLAQRMREELTARSISFDQKPFRAHITLARRARLPKGQLPALAFPRDAQAFTITLFKSELSHEGATYKPLYTVELQ